MRHYIILLVLFVLMKEVAFGQEPDPFIWLEEIEDDKALEWVKQYNEKSIQVLTNHDQYKSIYDKNFEIYNSADRIPAPSIYGDFVYNFWQDENHERGIWRRAETDGYLSGSPEWEIILDIDSLSAQENIKLVFKGASGLYPDYKRFLVHLSKGGSDAVMIKEFDVSSKTFINGGFMLPEAKSDLSWIDINTLMVSTDFGNGMTTSGYPRQVKIWKRGTPLEDAKLVFDGSPTDMGVWGYTIHNKKKTYQIISRRQSFYSGSYHFIEDNKIIKPDIPEDIILAGILKGLVIFQLKSDWKSDNFFFKQGSIISIKYKDLITGKKKFTLVAEPDDRSAVSELLITKRVLLVNMLEDVKSELYKFTCNGKWKREKIELPQTGNISLGSSDKNSDKYFYSFQNFLEPTTLYYGNAKTGKSLKIKSLASFFPTEKYQVKQMEAVSKDGTKIPYFVVGPKTMEMNGQNPTLLYAYGGFEIPMLPTYNAVMGNSWLEKGGVYVLANLRGGGEFGPKWHQAGLKENRQRVYDDFFAVSEDLIKRNITSPEKMGIYGGSNGGLLVGVAFTQRPDLYNAVVCAVPLLDMKRYNKLLAGASWMAEYGNPDIPEEWEYIKKYSPYQNVKPGMKYPEVFFTTSTRDDRVHPGHARKMVAKMADMGYKIYYYENTEGGHAGASTNDQKARLYALIYSYLQMKLMRD